MATNRKPPNRFVFGNYQWGVFYGRNAKGLEGMTKAEADAALARSDPQQYVLCEIVPVKAKKGGK